MKYNFSENEKKWQKRWEDEKIFLADDSDKSKKKFYGLVEFLFRFV